MLVVPLRWSLDASVIGTASASSGIRNSYKEPGNARGNPRAVSGGRDRLLLRSGAPAGKRWRRSDWAVRCRPRLAAAAGVRETRLHLGLDWRNLRGIAEPNLHRQPRRAEAA